MTYRSLPNKRRNWSQKVKIDGQTIYLTCGEYEDGTLGEVFITCSKNGTFIQGVLGTMGRLISMSLQSGVPLERIIHVLQCLNFPPNGQVIGSPVVENTTSLADWIAQELSAVYCSGTAPAGPFVTVPEVIPDKPAGYLPESWRSGV